MGYGRSKLRKRYKLDGIILRKRDENMLIILRKRDKMILTGGASWNYIEKRMTS